MRAVLIQSPCWIVDSPPYNLALLKAVSERAGHSVRCLDLNIEFYRYLIQRQKHYIYDNPTEWYNYDYVDSIVGNHSTFVDSCVDNILNVDAPIIGFTVTGLNIRFSEEIAKRVKNRDNSKIIIFGGPHCFKTELGERILYHNSYVDVVCHLEGEKVLPGLLDAVEKSGEVKCFPGMAYRDRDGSVINCGDAELIDNLNDLPFADYSDFNLTEYISKELPVSTSRGCINRCAFCNESRIWKRYRLRSAENVFREIKYQKAHYPFIQHFFFNDSLINGSINTLSKLCDLLIRDRTNILWGGQAVIREEMTRGFLAKLRKAGFCHVSYGLESASPRILKMIGKRFTPDVAEMVIRDTKKAGIRTDVNIIVGFPGENEEDFIATAEFLKKNKKFIDKVFFHPLVISPGTYFYEHKDELGIKLDNEFDLNSWYSIKEDNTLKKRLEIMRFYEDYIENRSKSFLTSVDYYISMGNSYFDRADYKKALIYYIKAKEINKNRLKDKLIEEKIELVQGRTLNI